MAALARPEVGSLPTSGVHTATDSDTKPTLLGTLHYGTPLPLPTAPGVAKLTLREKQQLGIP